MTEERSDSVAPEADSPQDDAAETVESLRAELEQVRAQHLRAVADYQNLQRRAQEERTEFGRFQLTASVLNFLPVLDDLERAVESEHEAIKDHPWVEGVGLVVQKFRAVLESAGVAELHALNQPFDPAKHEAVGSAPGPDGTVVRVLRRGYQLNDHILRAAMVLVGDGDRGASADSDPSPPGGRREGDGDRGVPRGIAAGRLRAGRTGAPRRGRIEGREAREGLTGPSGHRRGGERGQQWRR